MASAVGNLVVRLSSQTASFTRGMRGAQGMLIKTGAIARGVGTAIATALGPIAGIYGLVKLTGAGETFNQKMRQSLAIMGDVSDAMRKDMRAAAFEAAKTTRFSAAQSAEAFYFLASAGLTARQSIAAMPQVAKFAQAGNFDLARATELATDAQHALGMVVKDPIKNLEHLARVTDVLTKANTLADATTEQFSEALTQKAGAAFKIVGKDIEEAVAVLSTLAMAGRKGEEAGTQLSRVMIGLKSNAINNAAAFKRLGVTVFDQMGNMRNMADIVEDLERALGSKSDRDKQAAIEALGFTKRNADLVALLIGMSEEIRHFERELRAAGRTTQKVADKQLTPLQRGWAKLSTAFTQYGSMLMRALGPVLETALSATAKAIDKVRTVLSALGPIVDIIKTSVTEFVGLIMDGFKIAWNYIGGLFGPLQSNFAGAFKQIIDYLDVMLGSVEGWCEGVTFLWVQTAAGFMAIWEQAVHFFRKLWLNAINEIVQVGTGLVQGLTAAFGASAMAGAFGKTPAKMAEDMENVRRAAEQTTNRSLEQERKRHEQRMVAIGEGALKAQERWEKHKAGLPRLSDRFRAAEAAVPPSVEAAGQAAEQAARAVTQATSTGPGYQGVAALQRGTQEAWRAIMQGMGKKDVDAEMLATQKKALTAQRKTAAGIDEMNQRAAATEMMDIA